MRIPCLATILALFALVACSDVWSPHDLDETAHLARVAELLKQPPLRPLPATMAELHAPFPIKSVRFADAAGIALVSGDVAHAVVDLGSGEVIAARQSGGIDALSPNGRVFATSTDEGVEMRATESGDLLAVAPGAVAYQWHWVGTSGVVHIAPPTFWFGPKRLVFRDLATGLESTLASSYRIHVQGVLPVPGRPGRVFVAADPVLHEVQLAEGAEGWVATVVATHRESLRWAVGPDKLFAGDRYLVANGALRIVGLPNFEKGGFVFSGMTVSHVFPTGDPDRALLRILAVDGSYAAWRDFYYSLSRRRLAPLPKDALPRNLQYVRSLGVHVTWDEQAIRAVALPEGGEEGEVQAVLAAAHAGLRAGDKRSDDGAIVGAPGRSR